MTPIPDAFRKNGYDYKLVERNDKACIYSQNWGRTPQAYEVMRLRVRPPGVFQGRPTAAAERLPSDEDFGVWGWSYSASLYGHGGAFTKARAKFESVSAEALSRPKKRPPGT